MLTPVTLDQEGGWLDRTRFLHSFDNPVAYALEQLTLERSPIPDGAVGEEVLGVRSSSPITLRKKDWNASRPAD